jgi:transposase
MPHDAWPSNAELLLAVVLLPLAHLYGLFDLVLWWLDFQGEQDKDDSETGPTPILRQILVEMSERLRLFEERLKEYDSRISGFARNDQQVVLLMAVEGVGPITATALVATVGDARQFRTGRELSAWLGLTPRQYSSGERTVLLGISKRGDRYLRTLLIHGARSALYYAARRHSRRSEWLEGVRKRRGTNIAAVALANKNARVLWALLRRAEDYRVRPAA